MKDTIARYVESKCNSWSETTIRSERARLNALAPYITGKPEDLWTHITVTYKPYSRRTIWTRVSAFWVWACINGERTGNKDTYRNWEFGNAKLFSNLYQKERITLQYDSIIERVNLIEDPAIKRRALEILSGAVRYSESCLPIGHTIVGKGGKERPDFRTQIEGPDFNGSYHTFYRALKKVGLKPHTLRKLALTKMVEGGATAYDLMEVAGWSNPSTATSYIQPKQVAKLKKLLVA